MIAPIQQRRPLVPKYDYRCSAGHLYEKREGFDAPAEQECQVCGAQARRVLTPPAIVFKGSGWYITDSRKSGGGAASTDVPASTSENGAATTDTKAESKSDSSAASSTPAVAAD
jgi:putative FmdB family regulatory protein